VIIEMALVMVTDDRVAGGGDDGRHVKQKAKAGITLFA
jgi:hypothetical protein